MSLLITLESILKCHCGWVGKCRDLTHSSGRITIAECPKCSKSLAWGEAGAYRLVPENGQVLSQ